MNELKSNLKHKKPNPAKDAQGLSSLLGFLNDGRVTGAVLPPGVKPSGAVAITETPVMQREPTPAQSPVSVPTTAPSLARVFLTGRLKTGKDFIAEQAGCKIFALADPLYFLAEYFFGKQPKDAARAFLQTVGQWGRGTVSADYPLTPERALFCQSVRDNRSEFETAFKVEWASYGRNENIWLDSLIARMAAEPVGAKVAVSGVRFQNEFTRLVAEGFVPFHVMTSAPTWTARLQKVNLSPDSPECKNTSEHLAASLDANVIKTLSKAKHGPKLRAVWSDEKMQAPSGRLLTVAEFVSMFPK